MAMAARIFGVFHRYRHSPAGFRKARLSEYRMNFAAIRASGMRWLFAHQPIAYWLAMPASSYQRVFTAMAGSRPKRTKRTVWALQFIPAAGGLLRLEIADAGLLRDRQTQHSVIVSFLAIGTNLFAQLLFSFRLGWGLAAWAFFTPS